MKESIAAGSTRFFCKAGRPAAALAALLVLAACEACFITHQPLARTVAVVAGAPAKNLQARLCEDAAGSECTKPVYGKNQGVTEAMFDVEIRSEEISPLVCAYPKRYLVVSADNCAPQVADVYCRGKPSGAVHVELECGGK